MIGPLLPSAIAPAAPWRASLPRDAVLRRQAQELEATFLSAMLAHAGLDAGEGAFAGGAGEAQFASFLRDEQARLIAARGGIGLAERIFQTLAGRDNG
jgi:Rod binding domain-containing protein